MKEAVTHGVNGLHARAGDAQALANRMVEVVESDTVWETLRRGRPPSRSIQECADEHAALYQGQKGRRRAAKAGVQVACDEAVV